MLWFRFGYRPFARLLHRFNLHHTKRIGPLEPTGDYVHKCEWCGVSRTERTRPPYELPFSDA
jgi:hypothetical protein